MIQIVCDDLIVLAGHWHIHLYACIEPCTGYDSEDFEGLSAILSATTILLIDDPIDAGLCNFAWKIVEQVTTNRKRHGGYS